MPPSPSATTTFATIVWRGDGTIGNWTRPDQIAADSVDTLLAATSCAQVLECAISTPKKPSTWSRTRSGGVPAPGVGIWPP